MRKLLLTLLCILGFQGAVHSHEMVPLTEASGVHLYYHDNWGYLPNGSMAVCVVSRNPSVGIEEPNDCPRGRIWVPMIMSAPPGRKVVGFSIVHSPGAQVGRTYLQVFWK